MIIRKLLTKTFCFAFLTTLIVGCDGNKNPSDQGEVSSDESQSQSTDARFGGAQLVMPPDTINANPASNANRNAYFGDLHVHTNYSFDAFAFGTVASPYDAYRFARGEAIKHPSGFDVQLNAPLDFYAVTDHAMFLGAVKAAADTSTVFSRQDHVQGLHNLNAPENQNFESLPQRVTAFSTFLPDTLAKVADGSIDPDLVNQIAKDAWTDTIRAAEAFNDPGDFTTFVAYEFTSSTDDRGNLHRNVIFQGADRLPAMPFSRFHSQNPEGLWDWMDGLRQNGIEALAIPHNSNGSNGQMFKLVDWASNPVDDAWARKRIRNEPLVEVTQVKGTSETHPLLSDSDEWADFEIMPYRVATTLPSEPKGSYAREALLDGLALAEAGITNAYQFGLVGATDTHVGASSLDESNFFSKVGLLDADGERRGSVPIDDGTAEVIRSAGRVNVEDINGRNYATGAYETWSASGLTGVWAEENTREALYEALRRKEVFATSGPRIKIRLFAGYDYGESDEIADRYAKGVPMGAELHGADGRAPILVASALQDPNSAALQRLQIIKGWVASGQTHEQVYDVACSDGGQVDPVTHRCPDNGAKVDLSDCSITENVGAPNLEVVWKDPDHNPEHRAFYYARALENPTCRWSTWDAIKAGVEPRPDLKKTLQERAWTSPIWVMPLS
ncbi:MAG: hypothetical protein CMQ25_03075 [Gammaproteobacteria bacterium]|nr:hypothetical protein [Gammaproteobacteria bacterium]|tara:strand:- start:553 stop:2568 length:2016 start_codon:yes stop_codon:yes gene_type:complete